MTYLRCPLCFLPLDKNPQGVACANRHQFDRAKEGYLNLLPVQHKHSREPGDARLQLDARRQFLAAGYFSPLADTLCQLVPPQTTRLLDIGCGEGYFTAAMKRAVPAAQVMGLDIAKAGVRLAARQATQQGLEIDYAVASSAALPVMDHSMALITRIYAPSKDEELHRAISPDGLLILVTPGPNHLLGLRQRIYQEVRPHAEPDTPRGFKLLQSERVEASLRLSSGDMIRALLEMTPFAWRLSAEAKSALMANDVSDTLDFQFHLFSPC